MKQLKFIPQIMFTDNTHSKYIYVLKWYSKYYTHVLKRHRKKYKQKFVGLISQDF